MWLWVVGIVSGLLGPGVLIDKIAKEIDPEEGIKNTSDAQQIYMEQSLQDIRNDVNHPNQSALVQKELDSKI